eukprot:5664913-Prymnesium_polylepis.1
MYECGGRSICPSRYELIQVGRQHGVRPDRVGGARAALERPVHHGIVVILAQRATVGKVLGVIVVVVLEERLVAARAHVDPVELRLQNQNLRSQAGRRRPHVGLRNRIERCDRVPRVANQADVRARNDAHPCGNCGRMFKDETCNIVRQCDPTATAYIRM